MNWLGEREFDLPRRAHRERDQEWTLRIKR
jgi:hypothetical protein